MTRRFVAPHAAWSAVALAFAACPACTIFDGLSPSEADAGAPVGLLIPRDAVKVCSMALRCPSLFQSMSQSLGLPLLSRADVTTFSGCTHWLTSGLAAEPAAAAAMARVASLDADTSCESLRLECAPPTCGPRRDAPCDVPASASDVVVRCDGTRVVTCAPGERAGAAFDCAAIGAVCTPTRQTAFCVPTGADCVPHQPGVDVCDGAGRLVTCIDNLVSVVDCRALDLGTCVAAPLARCKRRD